MAWVYILECRDGSYYVGSATDLALRLVQHAAGQGSAYTRRRLPVVLRWSTELDRLEDAFAYEKQIQNWSRAKREALMRGDIPELRRLARGRSGPEAS